MWRVRQRAHAPNPAGFARPRSRGFGLAERWRRATNPRRSHLSESRKITYCGKSLEMSFLSSPIYILLAITLLFWIFSIPGHRRPGSYGKIQIPKLLAQLSGSKDSFVDWKSWSLQLGYLAFFLVQTAFLGMIGEYAWAIKSIVTIGAMGIIHLVIKVLYENSNPK
jgi:hypothetical protein